MATSEVVKISRAGALLPRLKKSKTKSIATEALIRGEGFSYPFSLKFRDSGNSYPLSPKLSRILLFLLSLKLSQLVPYPCNFFLLSYPLSLKPLTGLRDSLACFPALSVSSMNLLQIVIGSLYCLRPLRLARVIFLVSTVNML